MIKKGLFLLLLCSYISLMIPLTAFMKERPVAVKLGYFPEAHALKTVAGDHRYLVAQYAVVKVLFYFGTIVEKAKNMIVVKPEYQNMFKTLQTASKLDPWNADVYYFTQAAFTWELNKIQDVNEMLDYGMKHRTWDYQLPYFAGFNAAYFLKDYGTAAAYMKKAAELSKDQLMTSLASRYLYESGQNEIALQFIEFMQQRTMDRKLINLYEFRKKALIAVISIQKGVNAYVRSRGTPPSRIEDIVAAGFIDRIPEDPYGGTFYLDEKGTVRSTSKFAFGTAPIRWSTE
ncbi:hypothetical protein [Geomobilimonas luticola]|uniref:Tetratricopeptide repeat protein n=1 Tax=Geomobilimonas luticola TaxID=1114878 RepID=A0ABS5SCB8_9BACT|nr:hypothetical protein [Geomobilimonas luticola]MBT0653013.1 hypothetical protein [Geomobilimonas luticola]